MMTQSRRITDMEYSPIRKLSGFVEIAQKNGVNVLHLNIGQPDLETPVEFLAKIKDFDFSTISYTDSRGYNDTLNAFISYYKNINLDFEKEDIIITNGGSEALLFSFIGCCDVDDEILVPSPYYSNYNNFADMANIKLVQIERSVEDGFAIPCEEVFESKITEKTKAILICNPCNPTGVIYTHSELKMILDLAVKHNLYVICDEVYRDFIYDDNEPFSILNLGYAEERIIMVDSLSKRYSACGCRIGVLASKNRLLMDNVLKLCQSRLCVPLLEQVLSTAIVDVPKEYISNVKSIYEQRRNVLIDGLRSIDGVTCSKPGGAFYVIAKLPVNDSEHFAKWLVSKFSLNGETVMLAPASKFYGIEGKGVNEVRLSYCIGEDKLRRAILILKEGLSKYNELYSVLSDLN